ncbi:uncharacterized protein LOC133292701 [Gastrolobium bilobum]|uniref:uncharacterized protein LOC133292701 n=1 Tax=Gastrolobium bilobum TaxID=150636 RepID=UPI002AAF1D03|nr:uncharacterized protein LOC133292701 [Gastrolobium bilobum]
MVFQNKIQILALLETRISGSRADKIIRNLGFDSYFIREATRFSGGIWLLWNKCDSDVAILLDEHQFVHSKVNWLASGKEEFLTFVYGSPRRVDKRCLWENLRSIGSTIGSDWVVLGDFNAFLEKSEKQGGREVCWGSVQEFSSCLSDCNLSDLGFAGPNFTWKRGRLQERLDRVVGNNSWILNYPNRSVHHLLFNGTDHRPILLKDETQVYGAGGSKPFRFLAAWLTDDGFGEVVDSCWKQNLAWNEAKDKFHLETSFWHLNIFKEMHKRKKQLQGRLRGLETELSRCPRDSLERLHKELWQELNTIFVQEELTWFQRARCKWLAFGDKNSKFFHSATVARLRRNKVLALRKEGGIERKTQAS